MNSLTASPANNPHFGPVRNPWDLDRIPGGSSGGSAAALAAGLCYGSIGTDTGGSIRIPASLCGVVGLKPGLARVSTDGAIPLSTTLDFVGPMARTVADAALLFEAIATKLNTNPKHFFLDVVSPEIQQAFESSLVTLKKLGAKLKEVSLPYLKDTEHAGNQIAWAEATHYHQQAGWYPAHSAEYGEDVRSRSRWEKKFPPSNTFVPSTCAKNSSPASISPCSKTKWTPSSRQPRQSPHR